MATEIERKFLVDVVPAALGGDAIEIRQGYLAEERDVEVRIRIAVDSATLTVKAGRGRQRHEVEAALSLADADELWAHTAGRRIAKRRHRIPHDALVLEVDVYADQLAGLCIAEVEFPDTATADSFEPPTWFGTELTGLTEWSNAALARHGRPNIPE